MVEQLLYCSTAAQGTSSRDVFDIVEQSQRNNPARGITGFLLADSGRYLQFLEGSSLSVQALLARIEADPRHGGLEVVLRLGSEERWFPDWAMKGLLSFRSEPAIDAIAAAVEGREGSEAVLSAVQDFLNA